MDILKQLMAKHKEISHIKYLMTLNYNNSMYNKHKKDLEDLLEEVEIFIDYQKKLSSRQEQLLQLTLEQLKRYDGREGRPAYIAVDGKIYDVSTEPTWGGATHFGIQAGNDVSKEFKSCHNDMNILSKLKVVGVLKNG